MSVFKVRTPLTILSHFGTIPGPVASDMEIYDTASPLAKLSHPGGGTLDAGKFKQKRTSRAALKETSILLATAFQKDRQELPPAELGMRASSVLTQRKCGADAEAQAAG